MHIRHGRRLAALLRAAGAAALVLTVSGCFGWHAPRSIETTIERQAGVELRRDLGFELGPVSTRLAASFVDDGDADVDLRDLSRIRIATFEVTGRRDGPGRRVSPKDLGLEGWQSIVEVRKDGEQLLVLAKPQNGELREMMFLSIESDEVVYARIAGHLDRLVGKTLAAVDRDGARGGRAAIGVTSR